ncbi:MAG: Gfo/Idh/MocA family protein [Actinomycetes bacterium]
MAGQLRVGIVGYGLAGRTFHGQLISAEPEMRVAAVVTRNPQRQAQAATDHPGVAVHPSFDAMLDAGALDLVVIASPNDQHAPGALACVEAGVPVVVDKPLAIDAVQARGVVEHAARAGVPLSVFQNRRWDSDVLTLLRLISDGDIGEVLRFESRFERWRPTLTPGKRSEEAGPGGGILLDLGSHLVDQAMHLFGPVRDVYGELAARRGGADDDLFCSLEHESGVRSHLSATALAGAPGPRMRVLGTRGAYVIEALDGQEAMLRAGRGPEDPTYGVEPDERWGRLHRGDEVQPVRSERGRWELFYAGVALALAGGTAMPVDPWDAVRTLEVLDRVRAGAPTDGRWHALRHD